MAVISAGAWRISGVNYPLSSVGQSRVYDKPCSLALLASFLERRIRYDAKLSWSPCIAASA